MMAHSTAPTEILIPKLLSISVTTLAFNLIIWSIKAFCHLIQCTPEVMSKVQTTSHAASADTTQDQHSNNDDRRAVVIYDKSTAANTQVPSDSKTVSGVEIPSALSTLMIGQNDIRRMIGTGFADQYPVPPMSDKSLQNTEIRDPRMITTYLTKLDLETRDPHRITTFLTKFDLLRWRSTPFTLELIGNCLYCPRLVIMPDTPLSRLLKPARYPLDSAILLILIYRNSGSWMPCEAYTVLTVYDHLRGLDFSGINITLIDPLLFNSSEHSLLEKKAFHEQLGDWISLLYQKIEIPDIGLCRLETVDVNYTQLQVFPILSNGSSHHFYTLQSGFNAPSRIEIFWEGCSDNHPCMLENIIFCLCWMSKEFNSEDICTVIKWQFQDDRLEPHHIDIIGGQILQDSLGEEGTGFLEDLEGLSEQAEHRRKKNFRQDLESARHMVSRY